MLEEKNKYANYSWTALASWVTLLTLGGVWDNSITDLISNTATSGIWETSNILSTPVWTFLIFAIGMVILWFAVPLVIRIVKYVKKTAK